MALGSAVQMASGTTFGVVSLYFYGRMLNVHRVATAALTVGIACVIAGFALSIAVLTSAAQ